MSPIRTTSNQQPGTTQSVPTPSDTIAIAFGTITALLAILAIGLAWKQYRKGQHAARSPNFTFTIEPFVSSYTPSSHIQSQIVPRQLKNSPPLLLKRNFDLPHESIRTPPRALITDTRRQIMRSQSWSD
ncbi:hypothetical protein EG328_005507 [Venturia inaequalis]|uniref:Uncharacterized protein n=1 Tax=Venturia inaequalis TaxID=5025 RepID=A0A8H3ULE0_VENIN|nr:hypothetical protein EG328_005507 [Venturia inaequalis]RDI77785.1 hypothetical protein Vi05172_g12245 [Venturia inaequalis]